MTPIAGYENLTEAERKLFILGHNKHLSSLQSEERDQYGLGHVIEVRANPQESAVDVHFINGQQRQYTAKGVRN